MSSPVSQTLKEEENNGVTKPVPISTEVEFEVCETIHLAIS